MKNNAVTIIVINILFQYEIIYFQVTVPQGYTNIIVKLLQSTAKPECQTRTDVSSYIELPKSWY